MIRSVPGLQATITITTRRPYSVDGFYTYPESVPENIIQQFCDFHELRVTVSTTKIFRKSQCDPGIIVTMMSEHDRPLAAKELRDKAIDLAFFLKTTMQQDRAVIALPYETITLGPYPFLPKEKMSSSH